MINDYRYTFFEMKEESRRCRDPSYPDKHPCLDLAITGQQKVQSFHRSNASNCQKFSWILYFAMVCRRGGRYHD
jgi:hypothetical protein